MSFIINKNGERVHVDMEVDWFSQNCALYHDDSDLRKCYLLNLYQGKHGGAAGNEDAPILIKQIELWDEKPSKDKIMAEMWKAGLSRYDLVTIEEGYMLDWNWENKN